VGSAFADGANSPVQFGSGRSAQAFVSIEDLAEGLELLLRAGVQLHLELVEPIERPAGDQHFDLVDA